MYLSEREHLIDLYMTEVSLLKGRHEDERDRLAVTLRQNLSSPSLMTRTEKRAREGWISAMQLRDQIQLHITYSDAIEDLQNKCHLPRRTTSKYDFDWKYRL